MSSILGETEAVAVAEEEQRIGVGFRVRVLEKENFRVLGVKEVGGGEE